MNAVAEQKRELILHPQNIGLAEHRRQEWVVIAEEGTTHADVMQPIYWSHAASRFSPFDRIEVREETGAWILELVVLRAERNWAHVKVLQRYDLVDEAPDAQQGSGKCAVKWKGPVHKHCVIRLSDGEVLSSGHDTKHAADTFLVQYERTVLNT